MSFSEHFHHISKGHTNAKGFIPADPKDWPKEWMTIYYKTYPQLQKVSLPSVTTSEARLFETIRARASTRSFRKTPLTLAQVSTLFKFACGIQNETIAEDSGTGPIAEHHRAQPSGGGRFPIEAYLINFVEGELPAGVYHYDVKDHSLSVLEHRDFDQEAISDHFVYQYVRKASCAIVLTAVFERTQMKYGERGYRYALLEAGHIGQNVSLTASALGLGAVMMGGSQDEAIEKLLDVDGVAESVVYSMIIG